MNSIPRYVSFLKENRTKKQAIKIYNQRIKDSSEVFKKYSSSFYKRSCPICGNTKTKKETKFNKEPKNRRTKEQKKNAQTNTCMHSTIGLKTGSVDVIGCYFCYHTHKQTQANSLCWFRLALKRIDINRYPCTYIWVNINKTNTIT